MAMHFVSFLVIFALSIKWVSSDVSIDCGSSSNSYTDEYSIIWQGDADMMISGEPQVVPSSNSVSNAVMNTLRVFTTGKKNCYNLDATKDQKVLVRASFYYGNYDQKNSPPTFDLQFDGNYWETVVTSKDQIVSYETIYALKGDSLSVCVAQTKPNQFPFMSALEVRVLGSSMYDNADSNRALSLKNRIAFGINKTVRYIDDVYDRIWDPLFGVNGLQNVQSDALITVNEGGNNPPTAVLKNAIMAANTSAMLRLTIGLPSGPISYYINLYFSEVMQLNSTQNRSIEFYINKKLSFSDPIIPPYGSVLEVNAVGNLTASANTGIELLFVAANSSNLPPLINAMEFFIISDPLTDGTDSRDVSGLNLLLTNFDAMSSWNGDPCLPSTYTWDWLECSNGVTPRVTAMYLSSSGLSGQLPDFSSMNALEKIDLHNNSLEGPIPDFLGSFPNLKELNLADNQFSGSVPASLFQNSKLKLVVTGNPDLCTTSGDSCQPNDNSPPGSSTRPTVRGSTTPKKKGNNLGIILGTTIPIVVLLWAIIGFIVIIQHKRKTAAIAAAAASGEKTNGGATQQQRGIDGETSLMNEHRVNVEDEVHNGGDQNKTGSNP